MILQSASLVKISAALLLLMQLAACVTQTTGGFNVEVSEEQALEDYIALARGYLDQGDLRSAKQRLNNAADIDDNNAEIYSIRALIHAREGEAALADENFRRSLRIDSKNSQARNNYAAFLFANQRYQEAYMELEIVVQDTEYPARPQAFENLGLAALRLNDLENAEAAFSRAVQLNPNQIGAILELASINLSKQNVVLAAIYYRNYLTLLQFYNIEFNARGLWVGVQVELAQGNEENMKNYGARLAEGFRSSPEYQLYQQLLENRNHD